jgi:hypothetical protein
MASLTEAYDTVNKSARTQEAQENPQAYGRFNDEVEHPKPTRHILGLVGGNESAFVRTNWPDVESDLRGITRPNTFCPTRQHLPPEGPLLKRVNPKGAITIDTTPIKMREAQFWAYPAVIGPEPLVKETCGRPEKY